MTASRNSLFVAMLAGRFAGMVQENLQLGSQKPADGFA